MERESKLLTFWDRYNRKFSEALPKRIYSKWGDDLDEFTVKLPQGELYQLGHDLRGRGRWFVEVL